MNRSDTTGWALPGVIVAGLIVIGIVNAVPALNPQPSTSTVEQQGIHRHADGDLSAIARAHPGGKVKMRYALYLTVRDVLAPHRVVAFPGSPLDPMDVLGFTGARLVVDDTYAPELRDDEADRLLSSRTVSGDFETGHRWTVVERDGQHDHRTVYVFLRGRTLVFAPEPRLDSAGVRRWQ